MWFTVYRTGDLNNNERIISFFKKELYTSHLINKAKKQRHYGTKFYRKTVAYNFPAARKYVRLRALVSDAYRKNKKKYSTLAQLGKVL